MHRTQAPSPSPVQARLPSVFGLSDPRLTPRIETGSMWSDLVADRPDPKIWTSAIEPSGEHARPQCREPQRAACEGCHVTAECLTWALHGRELHPSTAGTAPWERKAMLGSAQRTVGSVDAAVEASTHDVVPADAVPGKAGSMRILALSAASEPKSPAQRRVTGSVRGRDNRGVMFSRARAAKPAARHRHRVVPRRPIMVTIVAVSIRASPVAALLLTAMAVSSAAPTTGGGGA